MAFSILDKTGTLWLISKVKNSLSGKVDKEEGKGLSSNDFTTSDKNKLAGIAAGAQVNVIETVNVNGTAQNVSGKAVNVTVPTKVSQLNNDSGYQTGEQVSSAINSAVGGITGFDFQVVSSLPTTGAKGVIYLVAHTHTDGSDVYDEYIWVSDKFEKLGNTDIDLSAYAKTEDFTVITETELTSMWNA